MVDMHPRKCFSVNIGNQNWFSAVKKSNWKRCNDVMRWSRIKKTASVARAKEQRCDFD